MHRLRVLLYVLMLGAGAIHATTVIPLEPGNIGSQAIFLNFDELAGGSIIGATYSADGVVFTNAKVCGSCSFAPSPPNDIVSTSTAPLEILFPSGATRVGIQIDLDGYDPDRQPQIRVFDGQDSLVGTQLFKQGPDFEGFEATQGAIYRVLLGSCATYGDSTCPSSSLSFSDAYDNLRFELAPAAGAPEPATFAILGLGLVAIAVGRRSGSREDPN